MDVFDFVEVIQNSYLQAAVHIWVGSDISLENAVS